MSIKDGGQAFPIAGYEGDSTMSRPVAGMTMRDYFAGQELAKQHGATAETDADFARVAVHCYRMADAMLAAREATP